MTDVYVECREAAPYPHRCVSAVGRATACLALHRVEWVGALRSAESNRLLCHFRAPDAEAVRTVLRHLRIGVVTLWVDTGGR